MALVQKQFGDLITFTRSSAGGRFNERGIYEMVPANQPRFNFNPTTLQPLGILTEESRTNQITFSSSMSGGSWVVSRATRSAGVNGPDGLPSVKIVEEKDAALPREMAFTLPITALTPQCVWVLVKPTGEGSKRNIRMNLTSNGVVDGSTQSTFDLVRKTITQQQPGVPAFMEELVNGWFVVGFVYTPIRAQATGIFFTLAADEGGVQYPSDGISGMNLCWPQLEAGSFRTSYIPTQASQVTRTADTARVNTLSPWFNPAAGTLLVDYELTTPSTGNIPRGQLVAITESGNNRLALRARDTAGNSPMMVMGNGASVTTTVSKQVNLGKMRAAFSYNTSSSSLSVNGESPVNSSSGWVYGDLSGKYLGLGNVEGGQFLNGYIRAVRYYPFKLTDAELQALTK